VKKEVARAFLGAESILVTSHRGIDGDSAGASLALLEAGRRLGKRMHYVNAEPIPPSLDFLPGFAGLSAPIPDDARFDLGLIVDTSAADRVGACWTRLEPLPRAVVDHHEGDGEAGTVATWIDPTAASVTIMVAEIFDEAGIVIDSGLALPLYVGLLTDTYAFQQSNTDVRAMRWGARFIEAGVKPFEVSTALFERKRLAAVRLCGLAAARARLEDGFCWSEIMRKDFAETGADESDTDGIVGTLRSIGGARVTVLFREIEDGKVKVNFRAKDSTDVAAVARRNGGGGHKAAAGCTLEGTLETVRPVIFAQLQEALA
jgi:phosphoesterase RecJ-like protein